MAHVLVWIRPPLSPRMVKTCEKSYLTLRDLVKVLRSSPKNSLLEMRGLGPSKVERLMEARNSAQEEGRPLRVADIVGLSRFGLGLLTSDPIATDLAKHIAYYETEFSTDKKLQSMVSR